ncbi:MAG: hypothetical protein ILO36_02135 [Abditibacteriota bacterium]|nr:hypothetical protein [Abditibacteriota bacterium]
MTKLFIITLLTLCAAAAMAFEASVTDYGAVPDGKTDCTEAFQKAIDAAYEAGGGKVRVPYGQFLLKGRLALRYNVTLAGEGEAPACPTVFDLEKKSVSASLDMTKDILSGSVLFTEWGAGDKDAEPFIRMERNTTLKGIVVYYPKQVADQAPVPYPWTVAGAGDNMSILDCLFVNPYQAIDFGSNPAGRHLIRNFYAQAIYKGIFIDKCYDVGRLENVHLWPFWTAHMTPPGKDTAPLSDWTMKHGTAFILSRGDWEYVSNCFCIAYWKGFHFKSSAPDGPGNYLCSQSGADGCDMALHVEETQGHSGVSFTNSQMFGRIVIDEKNYAPVKFSNCGFFGCQIVKTPFEKETILVKCKGAVVFDSCHFYAINGATQTESYFRQEDGQLTVTDSIFYCNDFLDPLPIVIEKTANSCIFAQNTLWTQKKPVNRKKGKRVIIKDNIYGDTK